MHAITKAVPGEPKRVRSKSVGLNNFSASLQILLMDTTNQVGLREVQFVITPVNKKPFGIQQGAHGPIAQDGPRGQPL